MEKWNLIIDLAKCHNCNNCVLAAKDEHVGNDFPGYSAPHMAQGAAVIRIARKVRGSGAMVDAAYLPTLCNHCDDAPCIKSAEGAVVKRSDGIVIIDPQKAKDRRDLVDVCPHGAIVWNEEQQLPQAWGFDAHLLDTGWEMPRCVQSCPTGVFEAIKVSDVDMLSRCKEENLSVLHPETRPRVYYRNLYRYTSCFIGGSACVYACGQIECVEGASVRLRREGELVAETVTDSFGDFKFDGLMPKSGCYEVEVNDAQYGVATTLVELAAESINLGEVRLTKP